MNRSSHDSNCLLDATFVNASQLAIVTALILSVFDGPNSIAADWPMWRYDARRSASSPERLPSELRLQWTIQQPAPRMAWPEDPRLHFDGSLEPIVLGDTLIVASSRNDSITAIATQDGMRKWRFFADGPIRFAPVAVADRIYFGADDGFIYCLALADGSLVWRRRAAPTDRRALGNERMTSVWPIRGGPVLADGHVYFTAGLWPFEGTQVFDVPLDQPGQPQWKATMLPDKVTPQGYLAVDAGRLLIPSGRDKAAGFDLTSREFIDLDYQSRGLTDYHVTAEGNFLLHGDRIYDLTSKQLLGNAVHRPITTRQAVYGTRSGGLVAYDLARPQEVERKDRRGKPYRVKVFRTLWKVPHPLLMVSTDQAKDAPLALELKAGERLYGIHGKTLFALDLPPEGGKPTLVWTADVRGTPTRLIAAAGKLFAATREGQIHCFGAGQSKMQTAQTKSPKLAPTDWSSRVAGWLTDSADLGGYCLIVGAHDLGLIDEILRQTDMRVLVIDASPQHVAAVRSRYDAMGLYGTRIASQVDDPSTANLPPYVVSLALVALNDDWSENSAVFDRVYAALRPYGGRVVLASHNIPSAVQLKEHLRQPQFAQANLRLGTHSVVTRTGALPGSAEWTHEYGDSANSLTSRDQLVKAPLGVLWFGGPSSDSNLFFNRHYWPPSLTVNQGRMFFQGPEVFVAVDIYTGRVLWKKKLPEGISPGRRGNYFEKVQVGFHFLAATDGIYLSDGQKCEVLHPATGKVRKTFTLPQAEGRWGTMRVWEDRLICTVFLPDDNGEYQPTEIVSLDRHTGRQVWKHTASLTAPVAALGGEQVFYYDGVLEGLYDAWQRKGLVPPSFETGYLKALDIRTGKLNWESRTSRAVTWLGFSTQDGVLVASNKKGLESRAGDSGKLLWEREQEGVGFKGHPESVWDKVILWQDRVIDQRGPGVAYDVQTGEPIHTAHPLSGEVSPWQFTKTGHHCNYAIASPHMLTFRADTAGFLDLESATTGRLNGFRSGCRNSLVPAGGILNAPNFAHGCVCSYPLFTSLALVHSPDADLWTYSAWPQPRDFTRRVGVNLGAPGDRLADNGTLWLDYPNVGGPSPKILVEVIGQNVRYSRGHSLTVQGDLPWVAASRCEGLTSLRVHLGKTGSDKSCRVRLFFAEPEHDAPDARLFDVALQGDLVLRRFDIWKEAGRPNQVVERTLGCVAVDGVIEIALTPHKGQTLLCGVEVVVAED